MINEFLVDTLSHVCKDALLLLFVAVVVFLIELLIDDGVVVVAVEFVDGLALSKILADGIGTVLELVSIVRTDMTVGLVDCKE